MKKHILPLLTLCAVLLNITACNSQNSTLQSTVSTTDNVADSMQTSEETSSMPVSTVGGEDTQKQGAYYDDAFVDFVDENPTTGAPMTYDDVMEVMTSPLHNGLDSYYLVETIGLMELSDAEKLHGFEDWYYKLNGMKYDGVHYGLHVIYKVRAIKDLITGEDCNKELFIDLPFYDPMYQKAGNPPYAPGEKFTVALFNKAEGCDITQSGAGYFFRFDIEETNNGLKALVREARSEICRSKIVELTRASKTKITSTTANPAQYVAEFELSELVDFLRKDWEERMVGNFEKS